MEFKNTFPLWENTGAEPPKEMLGKKENGGGLVGGYKPPADLFNWFLNRVSMAISEMQLKVGDMSVETLLKEWNNGKLPFELGGTNATSLEEARKNLDVYTKHELCDTNILGLFGLSSSSTPCNIFSLLGGHWWRRAKEKVYALNSVSTSSQRYAVSKNVTIYFSKTYTIDGNGLISLTNPIEVSMAYGNTLPSTYVGYYFSFTKTNSETVDYLNTNSACSWDVDGSTEYITITYVTRYGTISSETNGEWEYVTSINPNEYPNGTSGTFIYEYLGTPFENARRGAKVDLGTYIGTGTSGQSNPNTLTFDFKPKVVFIVGGLPRMFVQGYGNGTYIGSDDNRKTLKTEWNENSITWWLEKTTGYASNDAIEQCNSSGTTYYYVAIG